MIQRWGEKEKEREQATNGGGKQENGKAKGGENTLLHRSCKGVSSTGERSQGHEKRIHIQFGGKSISYLSLSPKKVCPWPCLQSKAFGFLMREKIIKMLWIFLANAKWYK